MPGVGKLGNDYTEHVSVKLYDDMPKAVFAAIAISLLTCGGDWLGSIDIDEKLIEEWRALHAAGIVPQRPPAEKIEVTR